MLIAAVRSEAKRSLRRTTKTSTMTPEGCVGQLLQFTVAGIHPRIVLLDTHLHVVPQRQLVMHDLHHDDGLRLILMYEQVYVSPK